MRQLQNEQKRAIEKYNREVKQHNQSVNRAINKYNSEVRLYNSRLRTHQQKVQSEFRKLQSNTRTIKYNLVYTSSVTLNSHYQSLESRESDYIKLQNGSDFLDLSERENANSLNVTNILESTEENDFININPALLNDSKITDTLTIISPELQSRWRGALFALNPNNPDAARHFCTSVREVFVQILEITAPDDAVFSQNPSCELTENGKPIRREKIKYLLYNAGLIDDLALQFVNEDVENILKLFREFNDGTHGSAGRFSIDRLLAIKNRVEDGISYLYTIYNYGK